MIYAYQGEKTRTERVVDTLLFHPLVLISLLLYIVTVLYIVFNQGWGLGLSFPFGSSLVESYGVVFMLLCVALSAGYLLIVRPEDVKSIFPDADVQTIMTTIKAVSDTIEGKDPREENGA